MLNNLKTNVYLVSLENIDIKNDKTGEVVELMKIEYVMSAEPSENRIGGYVLEGYSSRKRFNAIKEKIGSMVSAEIQQQVLKNGVKYKFLKIDNIEL